VIGERDRERIRALYDSNVSYQDQQLGRLLAQLRESGIADRTMIIVTADHGDELWEAGRVGHGGSLRDILVRVPLLIHYPPRFPAASVSEGVETIDIVPTIADVLGVPADPTWQGESLVGLASGTGRGYPRLAMASQYENLHTARLAHWKLTARGNAPPELFDLRADPHEKRDQSARQPMVVRWLADALWLLRTYNREWRKATWGNPANVTPAFARAHGE
jgi:arylsulfatase A-like enzyme